MVKGTFHNSCPARELANKGDAKPQLLYGTTLGRKPGALCTQLTNCCCIPQELSRNPPAAIESSSFSSYEAETTTFFCKTTQNKPPRALTWPGQDHSIHPLEQFYMNVIYFKICSASCIVDTSNTSTSYCHYGADSIFSSNEKDNMFFKQIDEPFSNKMHFCLLLTYQSSRSPFCFCDSG